MRRRRSPEAGAVDGGADAADVPGSLTKVAARGFLWSFAGGSGQAVLSIVSMVVLARLLTPSEFGAAAAAGVVVGLATLVSQLGVGAALVQRHELRDEQVSAAVIFSLSLSVLLGVALYFSAPLINGAVGLSGDSRLIHLLAVTVPIAGLAAVPAGLIQRRMKFRAMSMVDLVSAGPGAIGVSVVLAFAGFGAVSIVWGTIASMLITAVGYAVLTRPPLRLMGPRQVWREVRPLVGFGGGYSLSQLGNWSAQNLDNFVTANALGTAALGIYSRAYRLLVQPANLVGGAADRVLFPAMSQVRHDGERLRRAYLRATSLVALVAVPLSVMLFVLAPEIVGLLLGPRWSAVVVPLQVFALVLVPRASYKISGSLTRATGAVYRGAWRQWLYAAAVFVGCAIGARWGVVGVAVGSSAAIVLHFLVMLHFSGRVAGGLVGMVVRLYARKYLPLGLVVLGASYGVAELTRGWGIDVVTLLLTVAAGMLAAALTVLVLRRSFADELGVLTGLVRSRRRGKAPAAEPVQQP